MIIRFLFSSLLLVLVSACATTTPLMPKGAAAGYNITSVAVDASQVPPKQMIHIPATHSKLDTDVTRALTKQLVNVPNTDGRKVTYVFQMTSITLGDNAANASPYTVSSIGGMAELRDAKSGEVLVPAGRVFSATPRSLADASKMTVGLLTLNPNLFKTRQEDYVDTVNHFAATIRKKVFNFLRS